MSLDPDIPAPFREGEIWLVQPNGYIACSSSRAAQLTPLLAPRSTSMCTRSVWRWQVAEPPLSICGRPLRGKRKIRDCGGA